jgi:hypothetical protein
MKMSFLPLTAGGQYCLGALGTESWNFQQLVPVGVDGTPVVRALRLLWQEDERVIAELDRLLGPERTQQLLDHDDSSHSDATFEVGPTDR